jgi:hypothetical protein
MLRRAVTQKVTLGTPVNTLEDSRALKWLPYLQLICHAHPAMHILRAGANRRVLSVVWGRSEAVFRGSQDCF